MGLCSHKPMTKDFRHPKVLKLEPGFQNSPKISSRNWPKNLAGVIITSYRLDGHWDFVKEVPVQTTIHKIVQKWNGYLKDKKQKHKLTAYWQYGGSQQAISNKSLLFFCSSMTQHYSAINNQWAFVLLSSLPNLPGRRTRTSGTSASPLR